MSWEIWEDAGADEVHANARAHDAGKSAGAHAHTIMGLAYMVDE